MGVLVRYGHLVISLFVWMSNFISSHLSLYVFFTRLWSEANHNYGARDMVRKVA